MTWSASELARRLGEQAEAVCREYLSNGHRSGNHWIVDDVRNTHGHSMHVNLKASAQGPAGKCVEYVAPRVLLRICDRVPFGRRLAASTQHCASAPREVA
jgi:hypothetical protein